MAARRQGRQRVRPRPGRELHRLARRVGVHVQARKDVTFHDGTKFDASAVKATYDHIVDPATKSKSGLGALGPTRRPRSSTRTRSRSYFTAPNASFLHQQAAGNFGISSPTALKKYGATGFGNHPVGTARSSSQLRTGQPAQPGQEPGLQVGPAALSSKPPQLDKLIFRIVTDDSGRYNALQSGQLQIAMSLPPNDISAARSRASYKQLTVQAIGTPLGHADQRDQGADQRPAGPPGHHVRGRPGELVNEVLFGVDTPAHSVLTPITPGYSAAFGASCTPTTRPRPARCSTRRAGRSGPAACGPRTARSSPSRSSCSATAAWSCPPSSWPPS